MPRRRNRRTTRRPLPRRETTTRGASSSIASRATCTRSPSRPSASRSADAEDVFQEVFARAYENLPKLRNDDAIRPWLAQLTRRLCLDTIRAGAREQPSEIAEPSGVDDTIATLDEALFVHDALATLSEQLPRDPRPLLRPGRELPDDRRGARPPGGHDREPHLPLPRQAPNRSSREEIRSLRSLVVDHVCVTTTRKPWLMLLRTLPAAPEAWVKAAQEIPLARRGLDDIVERARADQAFREALIADTREHARRGRIRATIPALAGRRSRALLLVKARKMVPAWPATSSTHPSASFSTRSPARTPSPGGGSAAAIVVAMAAGLVSMVARASHGTGTRPAA